jgi:hypothetical protein
MWNQLGKVGDGIMNFAVPLGFAVLIVGSIAGAIATVSPEGNVLLTGVITNTGIAVTTWLPTVLTIFFALIIYSAYLGIKKMQGGRGRGYN